MVVFHSIKRGRGGLHDDGAIDVRRKITANTDYELRSIIYETAKI